MVPDACWVVTYEFAVDPPADGAPVAVRRYPQVLPARTAVHRPGSAELVTALWRADDHVRVDCPVLLEKRPHGP